MSAYAVNMAVSANAIASQTGAVQGGGTDSDVSFADLLSSVMNTGGDTSGLSTLESGIRWQDVQSSMMADAMSVLNQNSQSSTTDPILAQLMNMLKNLMNADGADAEGDNSEMLNLVRQMMDRLRQIADENGSQMAASELMAMMGAMGQFIPLNNLTELPTGLRDSGDSTALAYLDGSTIMETALGGSAEEMLSLLTGTKVQAMPADTAGTGTEQATQGATTVADALAAVSGQDGEDQAPQTAKAVMGPAETQVAAQKSAKASAAFGGTIRQAYDALAKAESKPAESDTELDIDALQQKVDAGVYLQNTTMAQAPAVETTGAAEMPLAEQLGDGLNRAITAGEEQIVLKLAPEDLGEVTIRLTRTADGLSLDIVARNAETQKLLSGEIDALKEAMKPHKVEVNSILTEQQDAMLNNSQQDPRQQDSRNWQPMRGAAYYGDQPLGSNAEVQALAQQAARPTLSAMLDAYI